MTESAVNDEAMLAQAIALSLEGVSDEACEVAPMATSCSASSMSDEDSEVRATPTGRSTTGTTTTWTNQREHKPAYMQDAQSSKVDRWAFMETPPSPSLRVTRLDGTDEEEVVRSKLDVEQWVSRDSAGWQTRRMGGVESTVLPTIKLPDGGLWAPNRECLELVIGMGISENAAVRALYHTGNDNPELAVAWVFENIESADLHKPFVPPTLGFGQESVPTLGPVCHSIDEVAESREVEDEMPKMVFVVNAELSMGAGKVGAQVGHATLSLFHHVQAGKVDRSLAEMKQWDETGARKVVVRGNNAQHLLALKKKAFELRIPNVMVHDAGRTQVEAGSLTVFALFGRASLVDQVTGKLRLL